MKNTILTFTIASLTLITAHAAEHAAVISPHLSAADRKAAYSALFQYALGPLPAGDTLRVIDGWEIKEIAALSVPAHKAYATNAKFRLEKMAPALNSLKQWFLKPAAVPAAEVAGGLRLPQIMDYVPKYTRVVSDGGTVLLFGTPVYHDPAEPAFSLRDLLVPADPHIAAARDDTPFGLKDCEARWKGVRVHWNTLQTGTLEDRHARAIERWWTLAFQAQGATLLSYQSSTPKTFELLASPPPAPAPIVADLTAKLEMRRILPREIPAPEPAPAPADIVKPDPKTTVDISPPPPLPGHGLDFMLKDAGKSEKLDNPIVQGTVRIGIKWEGTRDLDLYVTPRPGAKELYYNLTKTPEGTLEKDWSSPKGTMGYETVELRGPVDLRELIIAINFYRGEKAPGGPRATLRLEAAGRLFEQEIHIPAESGNRGEDRKTKASTTWTRVDAAVIAVAPSQTARK
jgi:hypothetical protein